MKMTVLFILVFTFGVNAKGIAQKITLSVKDGKLEEVFNAIKKQSNYRFFYSNDLIEHSLPVTINVHNAEITTVLEKITKPQNLDYRIIAGTISISYANKEDSKTIEVTQDNIIVSGTVMNHLGELLRGASVSIRDKQYLGTTTNSSGQFSLNSPEDGILVISFTGYKTLEVPVNNRTNINITLELNDALEEVVVVGYGTQQRKDILGSISVVSAEDMADRPATNFGYSLEGKAAGVQVIRSSGKPQAGFRMRVRGTTSITAGSEPLYVIDGVPTQLTYDINPADIEAVSILKDAASAAIYGAAGANGVVLITTKRGKNQPAKLTFDTYYGGSKTSNRIDVLDRTQYLGLMDELGLVADWNNYTANTDWHDEIYRDGDLQNYQLSLNGGNDQTKYYVSGAFTKENGIVRTNSMKRFSLRTNIDQQVTKLIKVGTSLSYSRWNDRNIEDNLGSGNGGVIMNVLTASPVTGIYNPDGTFTANPLAKSFHNPVAYTDGSINGYDNNRFYGNIYASLQITDDLKFRSMFGYDNYNSKYNYFLDPFRTDWGRVNEGVASFSTDNSEYWLSENTLEYAKTINEKHVFDALVGSSSQKTTGESSAMESKGFSGTAITTVNGGSIINSAGNWRTSRSNVSAIARVRYTYDDKYLVSSNFRADASSVFGPENRWGYFPSFSLGWRLSEENFLKDNNVINDLKIRYAWGQVGNDKISPFAWYGLVGAGSNFVQGGQVQPGTAPNTPENRNLSWEATTQNNLGVDISILNSRLTLSLDLYKKTTSDLLFDKPVPLTSGFSGALQNIGKLENKGIELVASSSNMVGEFKWSTDFNISFNRSKVGYIGDQELLGGSIPLRQESTIIKEGLPLGTFWGYKSKGVDPENGMMIYEDINDSGTFDTEDKTIIGNANPNFTYGLTNTFSYKNWNVNLFIQGMQGNDVFNATRIETEAMNDFRNQSTAVLNRWKEKGQITDIPKAIYGDVSNSDVSSRFIEDGSYLRIKSLTVGYQLPKSIVNKAGLNSIGLYLTGENLLTVTNYSGYDPESSAFSDNGAFGIDFGTYPQVRQIIFGLNVSF